MTFLISLVVLLIVVIAVCGLALNRLFLNRTKAQFSVDSLSTSLAAKINAHDRLGQMNELVESSRELVFTSRQAVDTCNNEKKFRKLAPLCDRLLDDARAGYPLVEGERKRMNATIRKEVQDEIASYNKSRSDLPAEFLSLKTSTPRVERVDLGRIVNVDSNIKALDVIPQLYEYDRRNGHFNSNSKLYRAGRNASLPMPDGDLIYNFCALPVTQGKMSVPPRNANSNSFISLGSIFNDGKNNIGDTVELPHALKVSCASDVMFGNASNPLSGTLGTESVGVSSGAQAESQ